MKLWKSFRLLLLPLLLLPASLACGSGRESIQTDGIPLPTRIFFLDSYNRSYEWSREIERGLREGLGESGMNLELSVEHFDQRRFSGEKHAHIMVSYLEQKYANLPQQLLLASDNPAIDFLFTHGNRLFPKIPLAFCGYNNLRPQDIASFENVTGINEEVNLEKIARIIQTLQPSAQHLGVITSTGNETDRRNSELAHELSHFFETPVTVHELRDVSRKELREALKALPSQSAILLLGQLRDEPRPEASVREIAESSPFPVYTLWDFSMGTGIVGGNIIRGYDQGYALSQLALRILRGESPGEIPPILETPTIPMFDHRALKRHGISRRVLPKGSILVNEEFDLRHSWEVHKKETFFIVSFIGILCGIIALLSVNIVRRRRAEESFRQKEQQLRRISDNLKKGFLYQIAYDSRGTIKEVRYVSEGAASVLNLSPEELYRDPMAAYRRLHPEDRQHFMDAETEALQTLSPFDFEGRILLPDNSIAWVHIVSTVHRHKDGSLIRDGLVMDITEYRHLLAERERLATAIQQTPETVIITDPEGLIQYVNPAFSVKTGYAPEEVAGRSANFLLGESKNDALQEEMWRILQAGEAWRGRFVNRRKDGTPFTEDATISPVFDEAGNIVNYVSFQRDITRELFLQSAKEELENLVRERTAALEAAMNEAISANRAKSAFLANMSHEIRTPLNAILGFASILERDPSLSSKQRDYLHTINRSGHHLLEIINDILSMSKIEAGKLTLNLSSFSLSALLEDLASIFRSSAENKGLSFQFQRTGHIPAYVFGDEGKLRQVFVNIIGNAVKFTKKGSVTVRVEVVQSYEEEFPLCLVAEIEDTGPGIAEEDLQHIFDAFRQSGTGHHTGGTGLGLSISRQILRFMGGDLSTESTLEKGSSFRFRVPLKKAADRPKEPEKSSLRISGMKPGKKTLQILVADDAPENRDVLRALLEPFNFSIMEASNGEEALKILENWVPDIVLMDMHMPVLDGYEAIRQIKKDPKKRSFPVIAVTARSFEDEVEKIYEAGADDYLSKPFSPESLFALLEKHTSVSFLYAQENGEPPRTEKKTPVSREDLARLPENLVTSMRQAVRSGDMVSLEKFIVIAENFDGNVADRLRELAEQYDYEKLAVLLE